MAMFESLVMKSIGPNVSIRKGCAFFTISGEDELELMFVVRNPEPWWIVQRQYSQQKGEQTWEN